MIKNLNTKLPLPIHTVPHMGDPARVALMRNNGNAVCRSGVKGRVSCLLLHQLGLSSIYINIDAKNNSHAFSVVVKVTFSLHKQVNGRPRPHPVATNPYA